MEGMLDYYLRVLKTAFHSAFDKAHVFQFALGIAAGIGTDVLKRWLPGFATAIPNVEGWEVGAALVTAVVTIQLIRAPYQIYKEDVENRSPEARVVGADSYVPHPHDIKLFQDFREKLPQKYRVWLGQHNMGVPFRKEMLDPFTDLAVEWVGAAHEFQDVDLQRLFGEAMAANDRFVGLTTEKLFAMDNNLGVLTAKTDMDRKTGLSDGTMAGIRQMNKIAAELSRLLNDFEKVAIRKLRVAA